MIANDSTMYQDPRSQVDDLFEAIYELESEALWYAAEAAAAADWWGKIGGWLSAVVFALSGATALLAFVTLRETGEIASTTLGVTALFLTLALAATLRLRPGAASGAATAKQDAFRRYIEGVRRFRRTEARLMGLGEAWKRFEFFVQVLAGLKLGRLYSGESQSAGGR